MSFQPSIPGLFAPLPTPEAPKTAPATEKQLNFARALAAQKGQDLPDALAQDRVALSRWIDSHRAPKGRFSDYPSSRQVAFAERIARLKRGQVPPECFRDRALMSRWIDSNKPR